MRKNTYYGPKRFFFRFFNNPKQFYFTTMTRVTALKILNCAITCERLAKVNLQSYIMPCNWMKNIFNLILV